MTPWNGKHSTTALANMLCLYKLQVKNISRMPPLKAELEHKMYMKEDFLLMKMSPTSKYMRLKIGKVTVIVSLQCSPSRQSTEPCQEPMLTSLCKRANGWIWNHVNNHRRNFPTTRWWHELRQWPWHSGGSGHVTKNWKPFYTCSSKKYLIEKPLSVC